MSDFKFAISLSILNHLGRNLYRSFATVVGEAISNSWDAGANNVWIYTDKPGRSLTIIDDGQGMTSDEFQHQFLKIGYSKRDESGHEAPSGRPYIGRKGIGKLALLSCSRQVTIISKKAVSSDYTGGMIDNSELDEAITQDVEVDQYTLVDPPTDRLASFTEDHERGTIIHFSEVEITPYPSVEFLRKTIALSYSFSTIDDNFTIHVNGAPVNTDDLDDLADKSQFLWIINEHSDPWLDRIRASAQEVVEISTNDSISGFIVSVQKPSHLTVRTMDEKVGVDFFVNGRVREKGILNRIGSARIVGSYLHGQIHCDDFDASKEERFTSNREAVKAGDPYYQSIMEDLKSTVFSQIRRQWDKLRLEHGETGDDEDTNTSAGDRRSMALFNSMADEFGEEIRRDPKVQGWIKTLRKEGLDNFQSYVRCFLIENLLRLYLYDKGHEMYPSHKSMAKKWREKEANNRRQGNISFDIRKYDNDLYYLDIEQLVESSERHPKNIWKQTTMHLDALSYKPLRDAMAHTAILTSEAAERLSTILANFRSRIELLIKSGESNKSN